MVALALETSGWFTAVFVIWAVLFFSVDVAIAIWSLNKETDDKKI
jgi:hypothetical protein